MLFPSNNPLTHLLKWLYILLYSYTHVYSHYVIHDCLKNIEEGIIPDFL